MKLVQFFILIALASISHQTPTDSNFIEVKNTGASETTAVLESKAATAWTLLVDLIQSVMSTVQEFLFVSFPSNHRQGQSLKGDPLFRLPILDTPITKHDIEAFMWDALLVAKKFYSKTDE